MPELYPSPASTSDNQNSLNEYRPLTLTPADISATMSMSTSCIHLPISGGGCKQQSSPIGSDQALQSQAAMEDYYFCHTHPPDGIDNDGLTIPEQVDHTSVPSLIGLRWIREHLLTLLEEQREGIRDKMAEIQIYTVILDRLKRGRGE
ncbi:uncharacterized protein EDB93DRAFT_1248496 [Suillus bovinus]|uniref:uncharacterized protein n=1 Tax=Suillus bovinus TaxID=48563 RepID=UPI001B884398|nr:uncharacterized protein EDB93DRAFT_1248496 [Suillus bovinus]KAG2154300.1 hypothetical protein EDB93DRAFT_1248496 [Suillus bovinus]